MGKESNNRGGLAVESDAKLGLLAGVAAVLVVAVVYFNKPLPMTAAGERVNLTTAADRPPTVPPASVGVPDRPSRPAKPKWDDD